MRAIRAQRAAEAARTGLHLSSIVKDIVERMYPPNREGIDERTGLAFQEIGNGLEAIVATQLQGQFGYRWVKPEPRTYRGIICSPDGDDTTMQVIHEIKVRWASCREFVEIDGETPTLQDPVAGELTRESPTFVQYKLQTLFYMRAWGYDRGALHTLFVAGDYRPPFPRPVTVRLYPTEEDLDTNEDLIVQHAIDMGQLSRKEAHRGRR